METLIAALAAQGRGSAWAELPVLSPSTPKRSPETMTKKQRKNEYFAAVCDRIAGGTSQFGKELRAKNDKTHGQP